MIDGHSPLKQRIFDDIFNGLALLTMLGNEEIEEVAQALERIDGDLKDKEIFAVCASAVRMAKE